MSPSNQAAELRLVDTDGPDTSCGGFACAVDVTVTTSPPNVLTLMPNNAGLLTSGVPVDFETHEFVAVTVCVGGTIPLCDSRNIPVLNVDEPLLVNRTDVRQIHTPENQPWTSAISLGIEDPDLADGTLCGTRCEYQVVNGSVAPPEAAPWLRLTPQGGLHLDDRSLNFETHPTVNFTVQVAGAVELASNGTFEFGIVVSEVPEPTVLRRPHSDTQQLVLSSTALAGDAVHFSELCAYDEDAGGVTLDVLGVSALLLWGSDSATPTFQLQAAPAQGTPLFNTSTPCSDEHVLFALQLQSAPTRPIPLGAYTVSLRGRSSSAVVDTPETRAEKQLLVEVMDTNDAHEVDAALSLTGGCFDLHAPVGTLVATLNITDVDPTQQHEFTLPAELQQWFSLEHECVPGTIPPSDMPAGAPLACAEPGHLQRAARIRLNTDAYDMRALAANSLTSLDFAVSSVDDGFILTSTDGGEHFAAPDGGTPTWRINTDISVPLCQVPDVHIDSVECDDCFLGLRSEGGNILRIRGTGLPPLSSGYPPFSRPELRAGVRNSSYAGAAPYVRWGMPCTIVEHRTAVQCALPAAAGVDALDVFLKYNEQLEIPLANLSSMQLAAPAIYEMTMPRRGNASADGGDEFTLVGAGFGAHANFSVTLEGVFGAAGEVVRREAQGCVRRENNTVITCVTPAGFGQSNQVVVTVGGRRSEIPSISYRPPSIQAFTYSTADSSRVLDALPTNGSGALLVISAQGFRLPSGAVVLDAVRSQEQQAPNSTASPLLSVTDLKCTAPQSDILCASPEGFGRRLLLQIQALGSVSELFQTPLVYAPPHIALLQVAGDAPPDTLPSGTAQSTSLFGVNFGPSAADSLRFATVRQSASGEVTTVPASGTHGRVAVQLPPGNGAGVGVTLEVDGIVSDQPHVVSYPPPEAEEVRLERGSLAEQPIVLRVLGQHFGSCCYWNTTSAAECLCRQRGASAIAVQVGGLGCSITHVLSNGELLCELQAPSAQQLQDATRVELTAAGLSGTLGFSYLSLVGSMFIDSVVPVSPAAFSTQLGGTVRIAGRGFTANQGFVEVFGGIRENASISEDSWARLAAVEAWDPASIDVRLPPGQGDLLIRAGMDGSPGSTAAAVPFNYPTPSVDYVSQTPVPTSGQWSTQTRQVATAGSFVVIRGKNFGLQSPLQTDLPQHLACGERASNASAGSPVQCVPGANAVWLGTKQCAVRTWNNTAITCFSPDGVGSPVVSIHVFRQLVPPRPWLLGAEETTYRIFQATQRVVYEGPAVQTVSLNTQRVYPVPAQGMSPAVGGGLVAVEGSSFGTPALLAASDMRLRVLLDGEPVTNITSHDHSLVTFIAPAGTGDAQLLVQVGTLSSAPFRFVYDAPVFGVMRNIGDGEKARALLQAMAVSGLHPYNSSLDFPDANSTSQVAVPAPGAPLRPHWPAPFQEGDVQSRVLALDARGGEFEITGWNFAVTAPSNASITVGGVPCLPPTGFANAWVDDSTLVCVLPPMTIGRKSLRIHILNTDLFVPAAESPVFVVCDAGYYATTPDVDTCEPCPVCRLEPCRDTGAVCHGAWTPPRPTSGFWQLDLAQALPQGWAHLQSEQEFYLASARQQIGAAVSNSSGASAARRLQPAVAPNVSDISRGRWLHVPCMPEGACAEDNVCKEGYTGTSCRDCSPMFYRSSGLSTAGHCVSCGARDYALWVLVAAVVVLAPLAYALNWLVQAAPSTAGFKNSVVLLQLFAVILRAEVPWSMLASALQPVGQATILSLALLPPDCSLEQWSYTDVWYAYQAIPLAVLASCLVWSAVWCVVLAVQGRASTRGCCSLHLLRPWQVALRCWTTVLDVVYVGLLLSAVEPFTCVQVGGKEVLQADFAVDCASAEVADLRVVAGVFLGLYAFALPVGQLGMLSLCGRYVRDNITVLSEPYTPREGMSSDKLLLLQAEAGDFELARATHTANPALQEPTSAQDKPAAATRSVSTGHMILHGFAGHLYGSFQWHASMWAPIFIGVRSGFVLLVTLQLGRPLSAGLTAGMLWGTLGAIMVLWAPHRPAQLPHSMAHAARSGVLGADVYRLQAVALKLQLQSSVHSLKADSANNKGDLDLDEGDRSSVFNRFHVGALYDSYVQEVQEAAAAREVKSLDPVSDRPRKRLLSVDMARPKAIKRSSTRTSALGASGTKAASATLLATEAVLPSAFDGLRDQPTALSRVLHASLYGDKLRSDGRDKHDISKDKSVAGYMRRCCSAVCFAIARSCVSLLVLTLDANRSAAAVCCLMLLGVQAALLNVLLDFELPAEMIVTYVQVSLIGLVLLTELLVLVVANVWRRQAAAHYGKK